MSSLIGLVDLARLGDPALVLHTVAPCDPFEPHHWWACESPERPFSEPDTWVELYCRPCVLALGAAALREPRAFIDRPSTGERFTYREAYDLLRDAHRLPELPVVP